MTIFTKIINNEIPSHKVYEDENFIAILDISPKQTGHTLVIPKNVKENVLLEDERTTADLFKLSKVISNHLMDKLGASGIKWVANNGKSAGQEVFHTHIHLIPYYDDNREAEVSEDILKIVAM